MFGWEWPPYNSGGLGTACEGLSRALVASGVELVFVLPRRLEAINSPARMVFADNDLVDFRFLPGLLSPYLSPLEYLRIRRASGGRYGLTLIDEVYLYAKRAAAIGQDEHFDVIHAHDWLAFPAGLAAKAASGKPLVIHVHATEFDRAGGSVNKEVYRIEKQGMALADRVIAVSNWTKNLLTRHYGVPAEKISVVHNGVGIVPSPSRPTRLESLKRDGGKIVLFVGRITFQKGPDYFVAAAKQVLDFCPGTYFVFVGDGDMMPQVIEQAARLGIADRVIFAGFLRGEELAAVYQAADLYVLPSVSEPFGITPLESLINGTPVLISKQSGISEVLSHALKVNFWDTEEMTNQIVAVLKYAPLRQTLTDYGREEAQRQSWFAAAQKCLEVYRQMISPETVV